MRGEKYQTAATKAIATSIRVFLWYVGFSVRETYIFLLVIVVANERKKTMDDTINQSHYHMCFCIIALYYFCSLVLYYCLYNYTTTVIILHTGDAKFIVTYRR